MRIRMYNITYFFKRAFQGIFRNGLMSFASVFVLASSILVMGCAWAVKLNVDHNLKAVLNYNKIVVFVEKGTPDSQIELLSEKILKLNSVTNIEKRSKEVVLEEMIAEYGDYKDIFEMFNADNPCRDELIITYTDPSKTETLEYLITNMSSSEQPDTEGSIYKVDTRKDVSDTVDNIKNGASMILTWLMILLAVVNVFIIMNTIKLAVAYRKEEIKIMRYIGASAFFISFPFVLEGIIIGLTSALIAYGLQYYVYEIFAVNILGELKIFTILPFENMWKLLLIAFLAIGAGLGIIGSLFSLRKYSKA